MSCIDTCKTKCYKVCFKNDKQCQGETISIPINFKGMEVAQLESFNCTSDENDLYLFESNPEIPWCVGCCRLRQCQGGTWTWILPSEDPYYFLDIFKNNLWKNENGVCSEIKGELGDKVWDALTGDIYNYTKGGWELVGNVEVVE